MSIIFDDLEPILEKQLAEEGDVSQEVARKLVAAVRQVLVSSADAGESMADIVIEDLSGHVVLLDLKFDPGQTGRFAGELARDESAGVLLSGAVAGALASAIKEWERQRGSYRDVLAALVPRDRGPLAAAALLQARRNALARQRFLEEFPSLTSAEVADAALSKATNRASLANRWRDEGRVFALRVGEQQLYPAFQLDGHGRPLEVVAGVLEHLNAGLLSDWQIALWFTSPNGWLGGRRPVDSLLDEPGVVLEAAEHEVGELVA
jgi:hypothetical protein